MVTRDVIRFILTRPGRAFGARQVQVVAACVLPSVGAPILCRPPAPLAPRPGTGRVHYFEHDPFPF